MDVWRAFVSPFAISLWLVICFSLAILAVGLFYATNLGWKDDDVANNDKGPRFTLADTLLVTFQAFCTQGINNMQCSLSKMNIIGLQVLTTCMYGSRISLIGF